MGLTKEDAGMIAQDYRLAKNKEEQIKRISFPALELMTRYFWPGNISELTSLFIILS